MKDKNCMEKSEHSVLFLHKSQSNMDNGWSDKGKKSPNLESVGFLGMSVGCPDKIHLCWKKCSTEYQMHKIWEYFYFKIRETWQK